MRLLAPDEADLIAAQLELDVDEIGICLACLSYVSGAIDDGDEREIRRWTRRMAPDLWDEGLEEPVRRALQEARGRGVPGTDAALAEVEALGARSGLVRSIVRRLATQLSRRAGGNAFRTGFLPWPPPSPD